MKFSGSDNLRVLLSFFVATLVTYTLASVAHTQQVISRLRDLGVTVGMGEWLRVAVGDWLGLYLYLAVIAVGLAIAFSVMSVVGRFTVGQRDVLFAVGGGLAMWVMLYSMKELGSITPIAGARGIVGLLLQCAAGVAGGFCFALFKNRAIPSARKLET